MFSSLAGLIVMGYFQWTCNYSKMFPSNAIRHALFVKIPTDRVTRELVTSLFSLCLGGVWGVETDG